ncbi:putative polysaccharide export protein [Fimbriiglobus ruber]|uniref:Putative polysaccharide export protein n=2 Tax=Fimbriiglobus ruber TaxID=1908690 RepID=A0A225E9W0_9BACT|nr:putative polysaccharide export protein [Fimbriiglobus ruber]
MVAPGGPVAVNSPVTQTAAVDERAADHDPGFGVVPAAGVGTIIPPGTQPHFNPAQKAEPVDSQVLPKELNKVTMPPYVVEAPDILVLNAQRLVPLPPYFVQPLDVLYLFAPDAPEKAPINRLYQVDPDGTLDLGPNYGGALRVMDLNTQDIEKLLSARLKSFLKNPTISVSLAQSKGIQTIQGQHIVRPDGTVSLGFYGSVYVAGMTLPQIKAAIELHLSRFLYKPEISVDMFAYNSKYYYVITDFAGSGEQVVRIPSTGNETVLDAISFIGGLSAVSTKRLWIARPAPAGVGDQILPVDWKGITRRASTGTNYQLLPGDRLFVMGSPAAKVDNAMARTLAPVNRAFGAILLGTTTVQTIQNPSILSGVGR